MKNNVWLPIVGKCYCCQVGNIRKIYEGPDRFFKRGKKYPVGECDGCGSTFLLQIDDWSFEEAYPTDYEMHNDATRLNWRHKMFSRYCFPYVPAKINGRIVDMGCGTGLFVEYLLTRHKDVLGIEVDKTAVEVAQSLGRPVVCGDWESASFPPHSLAVLSMNHVIEHLPSPPAEVFVKARNLLQDGGYWIFRTPNSASWGRHQFNQYWFPQEVPRHLVVYTPKAIRSLAKQHGFSVEHISFCGRAYELLRSAEFRRNESETYFFDRVLGGPIGSPVARILAIYNNIVGKGDVLEVCLKKNLKS